MTDTLQVEPSSRAAGLVRDLARAGTTCLTHLAQNELSVGDRQSAS